MKEKNTFEFSFSRESKKPRQTIDSGPDYINPRSSLQGKLLTFPKDQANKGYLNDSPGPASYNPNLQTSSPRTIFGREGSKSNLNYSCIDHTPGPGAYRLDSPLIENRSPRYSFGNKQIYYQSNEDNFPGPGTYNVKYPGKSNVPGSAFLKDRREITICNECPGPATYNPLPMYESAPSYT